MLNSRAAMVVYAESFNLPAAIAVPKYRPDWAAAAPNVEAASASPGTNSAAPATANTLTAPASTNRYRAIILPFMTLLRIGQRSDDQETRWKFRTHRCLSSDR